jgi:hypothetical protein
MTIEQLKNEVQGLLTTVSPDIDFYVGIIWWSRGNQCDISLAIYPEHSANPKEAEAVYGLYKAVHGECILVYIERPKQLLIILTEAVHRYKKTLPKDHYKTIELVEEGGVRYDRF